MLGHVSRNGRNRRAVGGDWPWCTWLMGWFQTHVVFRVGMVIFRVCFRGLHCLALQDMYMYQYEGEKPKKKKKIESLRWKTNGYS